MGTSASTSGSDGSSCLDASATTAAGTTTTAGSEKSSSPSGGIDQGFFDGRPIIDVEASIELRENTMLMVGAQNVWDTYPQVSARATSVGEKYSEYTPWGFNGAYFYTRIAYTWDR